VCRDCATESNSRHHVSRSWIAEKSITMTRAEEDGRRDLGDGKAQR
jgi:hypothetical protein